jgi:TolB-like protein/tetratricopeptide (TPR) repeat protein/tRNA A-37 threonylcarbamoyl transferase component Bud32
MTAPRTILSGTFAERYAIQQMIGSGGAAHVYLARDLHHGRDVALKVLRPEIAAGLGAERFLREIRIAARLSHPHILPLHDAGETGGVLYYVMPYVGGGNLRERLASRRQLGLEEAITIAGEVADGLEYAHRQNVVHRDVKPANILFHEQHAVLVDFGVARALRRGPEDPHTDPGFVVGTPEYMSPEACAGEDELDAHADQYSLACVAYEMLAGHPPFTAATPRAVVARHIADTVPPLTTVRPDVPSAIAEVLTRALAKVAADRYASLGSFAEALKTAAVGVSAVAARAVAVLPLVNAGGLPDDEALSDGITDEIIAALSRVEGLRVASRTSAFALKGAGLDAPAIGQRLHVGSMLEGSVRRVGDRLRVAVQLVSAQDGCVLWGERYDRAVSDVFAIQDEIAESVARALRVILHHERRVTRPPTGDVRAYECYLKGRQYFREGRRKSLQFAREMFQRAIAVDQQFALAWAGIADCCSLLNMFYPETEKDLTLADHASARALGLAPDLPEALAARGFALWRLEREAEAIAAFERAMRLDARQFEARYFLARLRFQRGELERAAELFEDAARAREDYEARFFAAQSYAGLGRKAEAEAAYRRGLHVVLQHLEMNPDDPGAATMCAVSLCRLGRAEEGLAWAERAREIDPSDARVLYNVACLYALEGKTEQALDGLEQAVRVGFGARQWIAHDPDLDGLRDHPRFKALLWP